MRMYAATPVRATRQVVGDLLFVLWLVGWVWIAVNVHDATMMLAGPGRQTDQAATSLSERLREAGSSLEDVPIVGDEVASPFGQAADASEGLASAGRAQVAAVEDLALWLGLSVGAIPILVVGAFYLPVRYRFVRRASAAQRFVDADEDLDLFALRALARQPMHVLAGVSDDPAGEWRRRDPVVTRALAELELRASGLRPPRPAAAGGSGRA